MNVTVFGCDVDEAIVFRERAPQLGVTPIITAEPVSESSIDLVGGSCVSVSHKSPITRAHLTALAEAGVRYVSTRSIGYNHVDVAFAHSIGITVENVAYSPDSVADHTLMLILMALRHAKPVVLRVAEHDYRLSQARGRELRDLTVGVVGTGRIGSAVIERLRGFGCRILATDRRESASAEYVPLDELLQRSDVVTLHTPLDESTHHLLDARAFDLMRPGAVVINTGRGSLIDSAALLTALESGRLAGAGLDVIEGEDGVFYVDRRHHPVDDTVFTRLHARPDVVITPHSAYFTDRALRDAVENSLINCLAFEREVQRA